MTEDEERATQDRPYTPEQMRNACMQLIAAELTLAGNPAIKVPTFWPGYDVIAQPPGAEPQLISVKSCMFKRGEVFVSYLEGDTFDWLAIIMLPGDGDPKRRFFLIPRAVADAKARHDKPTATTERYYRIDEIAELFAEFEDNFILAREEPRA
jgi:hypothetical protein